MINPTKPLLNDTVTAQLVGPDGALIKRPALMLTMEEAKLLRAYKKFLLSHRLREAPVRCEDCFANNRNDFHTFFVLDEQIMYACDCKELFYRGQTL